MQDILARLRYSVSLKVAVIGFLILVLLIPLAMIRGVVTERGQTRDQATAEIADIWGRQQLIAGPVLVLPYATSTQDPSGNVFSKRSTAYVLPRTLNISANVAAEFRYRGLHRVPVYRAELRIDGVLPALTGETASFPLDAVLWNEVYAVVSVSDARALTGVPTLSIGGEDLDFTPAGRHIGAMPAPIAVALGNVFSASARSTDTPFTMTMTINGTDALQFLPFGDTTTVSARSSWPSPSFVGSYLPASHAVNPEGFRAEWQISSIGRALPSQWTEGQVNDSLVRQSAFGLRLYLPIDLYRLTERAAKYGILFIGLSFATYFIFEVVLGLSLHPLQYLLVGFANAMFYLLLISLAEHVGFGWAYITSAACSALLIAGYSQSVLGSRGRAAIVGSILVLLYAFLYMTLRAETYALLTGSIGLWLALAFVMYLTRRIDWYGVRKPPAPQRDFLEES